MTDTEKAGAPEFLRSEDCDLFVLVSEFTEAARLEAAVRAYREFEFSLDEVTPGVIARLAETAAASRLRQHTADNVDCECGGERESWWCDYGKGDVEGLYVMFEFAVAENIWLESMREQEEEAS